MDRSGGKLLSEAAASVDAPAALVPVLGELFRGMDSLGSSPALVIRMLRRAGVGEGHRVLDLGCGQGGACVAIASRLGARCTGIDAVPEFIDAARQLATRKNVSKLCTFRVGNIRRASRRFDAAIMLGVLDVVRARPLLRKRIKRGGVYIIDDAVGTGQKDWLTLDAARVELSKGGDKILAEGIWTPARVKAQESRLYSRMARNAARLARERPTLAPVLKSFLHRQKCAAAILRDDLRPVQWMVRRGD